MIIKSLEGIKSNVALSDLYIKPFFNGKDGQKVEHYSICSNENNVEVQLGKYSDKSIAKHMLHLLSLYENCPLGGEMLTEIQLCQDMLASINFKLERAKEAYIKGDKNNG